MVVVWAFASGGTGCPCRCGKRNGGLPSLLPACLAFSLLFCPHPPAPLPGGKGESQSLFRRGLRPRRPGAEPLTALTETAVQVPYVGKPAVRRKSEGKRLPIVSPVSPGFSPGDARGEAPAGTRFPQEKPVPHPTRLQGSRGRSPRRNKLLGSPFSGGEGGRGDGGRKAS